MPSRSGISILKKTAILIVAFCLLLLGVRYISASKVLLDVDFSIYWQAGKALFLQGFSPYSDSVTRLIQLQIYKQPALSTWDQLRYAYPPYSLLIIFPSVWMTYPWAQSYWVALNIVLIFMAVFYMMKKPSIWLLMGLIFFYPVFRGIILGQFAFMIGAILIIAYRMVSEPSRSLKFLAGILLAWCCMKPHMVILLILFFILQMIRDRNKYTLLGLLTGGILFAGISFLMYPNWLNEWMHMITEYTGYMNYHPIIGTWLSVLAINWGGIWVKIILGTIAAAVTVWMAISWYQRQLQDYLILGWLVLVFELVNPNANSLLSDQILFLLPLLIWMDDPFTPEWIKGLSWGAFIVIPWILFFAFLKRYEPYEVAMGLAGTFSLWLIVEFFKSLIQKRKMGQTREDKLAGNCD